MERKEYLELCRRYAVGDGGATVMYAGGEYKPLGYLLWYDRDGNARHTAVLLDRNKSSMTHVLLEKVGDGADGE